MPGMACSGIFNRGAFYASLRISTKVFAIFLLVWGTRLLAAQLDRGSLVGIVTDSSGALVPHARVSITSLDTGVRIETRTGDRGFYRILNIPAGSYKASVEMNGFKTSEQPRVVVTVSQTIRFDVRLEPGAISETVYVTANSVPMGSDPILVTSIQGETAKNLPLSISGGRSIESFAYALANAAEGESWSSHIAGSPAFTKEVLIDGLSATSQIQGNVLESGPTLESIKEFSVQIGGFSAEYGRTGGGVFNFALAHGTNRFSGSGYYYGRNEVLNANSWMNNWQLSRNAEDPLYRRARDRQSVVGGSAGGPLTFPGQYSGKNKTHIFGTFEHYRQEQKQIGSMNRTVPIPEFLEGDFSSLLTTEELGQDALGRPIYSGQIFDPLTMRLVNGGWVSDPFPNNIIPPGRMSRVSRKVIDLFRTEYKPMIPGLLTDNSAGAQYQSPWFHQTLLTLKADHQITSDIKLTGSLIWTERPRILLDQGGIWDPLSDEGNGGPLARARKQEVASRAMRLTLDWNIHPNLIGTGAFVYNRYSNPSLSAQANGNWQKYLGFQNSTSAGLFPEISFGPAVNGVKITDVGFNTSNYSVAENTVASMTMAWLRGLHSVKFGGELWAQRMNSHSGLDALNFGFSSIQTGIPGNSWSNRVGFGFASFFLGEAQSGSKSVPFDLYGRRKYAAFFIQDSYRIRSNLTLDTGLRWEQSQPLKEKYGRWASFSPVLKNTKLNLPGALEFLSQSGDTFEKEKDWKEFGPRLGLAYSLGNRLVARAGYGISYITPGMNYWSGVPYGFAPGYRGSNTQNASLNLSKFNWDSGYPDNYQAPARDPNALVYGMVSVDPRSLFAGYIHQYHAGLEFEFGAGMVLQAEFLGNQGRRLHNGALNRNQPQRSSYENAAVDPWSWVWDQDSAAAAGVSYPYPGFSNFAGVALQPFPHVASETGGPLYSVGTPTGSSGYKAFLLSLAKRTSGGLSFQLSYNLSRTVGNSETGFEETWDQYAGVQDIHNLAESAQTVVGYDQTHVFKGYVGLQLPFGKNRRFLSSLNPVINGLVSGWNITGVVRYNSGYPLAIYPNVWYPGWEGSVYADFNRNLDLKGHFDSARFDPAVQNAPANRYFNPAAFSNPAGHLVGNGKRFYTELRGFGYANEDIAVTKQFRVEGRATIQLRAEFLNAFNRHHFADPNTSLGNPETFGNVTALTGSPRIIQFGLRMEW